MDDVQSGYLKSALEALLFVSDKPVMMDQVKNVIPGVSVQELKDVFEALEKEYNGESRGMVVIPIAGGWQMLSGERYAGHIREFFKTRHKEKLSRPALEALAIIAYKQPVSRADIEVVRGVNSDGVVLHLLNKGLITISGRKEVPGRPYVYSTTGLFLEYFGLRVLQDLPKLEDFSVGVPNGSSVVDVEGEEKQDCMNVAQLSGSMSGQARQMLVEMLPEGEKDHGFEEASSEN